VLMAKSKKRKAVTETDSAYLLKLVLYLIVGSQWIRLVNPNLQHQIPIPIGLVIGIIYAWHDHFQIDRKVEYAVLLISMMIGYWLQTGVYITILK
jgi:hypothetical protein